MTRLHENNSDALEFLLSQYIDRQLDEETRADLERRLAADAELRVTLSELQQVDAMVRRWAEHEPAIHEDAFVEEARRRREAVGEARRAVRLYRLLAPLAVAAAIGLVVTGLIYLRQPPPERPEVMTKAENVETQQPPVTASVAVEAETSVVVVSFSKGREPGTPPAAASVSRLVVTAGAIASADSAGLAADEAPLF